MKTIVQDAIAGRLSRRQALVASGLTLLAYSSLGGAASAAVGDQDSWRFCSKCFSMYYDGAGAKGKCPADGGGHTAQGFFFTPHYDDGTPKQPNVQYDWRFCQKCFAMFYNSSSQGKCPSGGSHVAQGFNFGLDFGQATPASMQTEWRFCQKCFALFYNGGGFKGHCAAGGGHVAQGFVFNLPYRVAAAASVPEFLAFDNNDITFERGIAAGGNSHVVLHRDGRVEFKSHFHDSGSADYHYSITWAIYAADGTVFTLHHRGKIVGHLTGGQSDRSDDFNGNITNADVAQHWPALARASTGRMSAHVALSLDGVIDTGKEAIDAVVKVANSFNDAYQSVGQYVGLFTN